MPDRKTPDKSPRENAPSDISPVAGGLRAGLSGLDFRAIDEAVRRNSEAFARMFTDASPAQIQAAAGAASGDSVADAQAEKLPGAIAGGKEDAGRRRRRATQGKALLHGADRTVRVYKLTEAELERLGELSEDENAAWGRATFCGGLVVNVILGLLLASGLDGTTKAVAAVIGVCALVAGLRFWRDAMNKRRDGKSLLGRVKEDHDFANI
jgi:hypothetical protein